MPKHIAGIFLISVIIGFACRGDVQAQQRYEIIAVKGKVGIIRTPVDRPLQVGETFTVVRYQNGTRIEVAQVKVALVEKKFTGIKVIKPLQEAWLSKGDLLEVEPLTVDDRLENLDDEEPQRIGEITAGKSGAPLPSEDVATKPKASATESREPDSRADHPAVKVKDTRWANRDLMTGPIHVVQQNRPFVGPLVALFMPVNALVNEMDISGQAGVQVTTLLRNQTHLRFGLQYAPLRLNPALQNRLQQLGLTQTSYFLLMTVSLQQYFARNLFWSVGGGIYRLTDIQILDGSRLQVSKNYLGIHAGAGINLFSTSSSKWSLATTGHMYFPNNTYRMFLSFLLSWAYAL